MAVPLEFENIHDELIGLFEDWFDVVAPSTLGPRTSVGDEVPLSALKSK